MSLIYLNMDTDKFEHDFLVTHCKRLQQKVAELEKERDELKSTNRVLDNQLNELYHAMELISKIATSVPRDTAILEIINCYRTGELLQAHNLERQISAVKQLINNVGVFQGDESVGCYLDYAMVIDELNELEQAKQLREGVSHE